MGSVRAGELTFAMLHDDQEYKAGSADSVGAAGSEYASVPVPVLAVRVTELELWFDSTNPGIRVARCLVVAGCRGCC